MAEGGSNVCCVESETPPPFPLIKGEAPAPASAELAAALATLMDGWHRASPATGADPDAAGLAEEQSAERRHRASVSAAEDKLEEARARHGWELAQAQRLHDAHCRVIADVRRWRLRLDFALACVVHHAQQEYKRTPSEVRWCGARA